MVVNTLETLIAFGEGHIKRWDEAPELDGTDVIAKVMQENGIMVSVAHTNGVADVCCAFIEAYANMDPYSAPLDVVMDKASDAVKEFALEKINLLQRGN